MTIESTSRTKAPLRHARRISGLLIVLPLLPIHAAAAGPEPKGATKDAELAPAIIDTVSTTGPGVNRPWKLFAGEPWRSGVTYEEVTFTFTKKVKVTGVRVTACRPPDDELEVAVGAVTEQSSFVAMEPGDEEGRRSVVYEAAEPVEAWAIKVQLGTLGQCLGGLALLGPGKAPLKANTVDPVASTGRSEQTYGPAYDVHRMFDGDFATAWSTKGDGTGAELRFELDEPRFLTDIYIWPGYHRSVELWKQNGAPAVMSVIVDDGAPQRFELPKEQHPGAEPRMQLAERVKAKSITLRIEEVRPGSRYKDTLISELRFADGDAPFVPDPTPSLKAHSAALREQLASAGLGDLVDRMLQDDGGMWNVGLFGDGRFYLRRYADDGGDFYRGELSFEVKDVKPKQATLRVYGALTHIPSKDGKAQRDKRTQKTINGQLLVVPTDQGVKLTPQGALAKALRLPGADFAPAEPTLHPGKKQLIDAGFKVLTGYAFRAPKGSLKVNFYTSTILRLDGDLGDPSLRYFAHLTMKRESLEPGRAVYAVSGNVERIPYEDGKRKGRGKRQQVTGKLEVKPSADGLLLKPSGDWLSAVPLPEGSYALDW